MTLRRGGLAIGAAAGAAALMLAACGTDSEPDEGAAGAPGGSYSVGSETPESLVPSNCYDLYCANILQGVVTGLFTYESDGSSVQTVGTPLLNSLSTPDGGSTYVIEINEGSSFTNGEAITAQTFVDTWNFTANGGNGQELGFIFGPAQLNVVGYEDVSGEDTTGQEMAGLRATSDTTIEISLVEPIGQTLFQNYLGGPQVLPMPSVAFDDPEEFGKQPIGNGPYMVKDPVSSTGITLVRNEDYAYDPGMADEIEFTFYTDMNTLWVDLQGNKLDVSTELPDSALGQAEAVLGDRFINEPAAKFSYWAFPEQVEAFKDRDVRVALAKAVDWAAITDTIYANTRVPATAFGTPGIPGGGTDACGEDCTYDPEAARDLLNEAGGIPGNKVSISGLANQDNTAVRSACDMIQKNLGVQCTIEVFEDFGEYLGALENLSADDEGLIISLGWTADNPTLSNMIAPLFSTGGGANDSAYSNPEFDRLIAEGNQAGDEETAVAKWQEAQDVLYEDFGGFATMWRNTVGGYSENVSNVKVDPAGFINLAGITVNSAG